jgi:uncharacterized protein (TIGR03435 family)
MEVSSSAGRGTTGMKMSVTASLVIVAAAIVAVPQDIRFQTATMTRNQSGSLCGGSQILPDGRVIITNTSVLDMLRYFYDVPDFAIIGAPQWFTSERYDITAQAVRRWQCRWPESFARSRK